MIGNVTTLPEGYIGAIYGKTSVEELVDLEMTEVVNL